MSPIEACAVRFGAGYKWYATIAVMLGTVVTTAAATMVNVAMPDIMGAFGLGADQVQWLSTGFLAAMTATMLLTDWALDQFGYRLCFAGALTLFIIGSIVGATSASGSEIIVARVMQGMASGLIQPSAMVVLSRVFTHEQRGRAMGVYGIGVVLAPALGPTLAGFLIDEYNWRYVFVVMAPVCIAAIVVVMIFLPGRDTRRAKAGFHFDGVGFFFLAAFLVCLLSALSNGQRQGWNSDLILAGFAFALASAVAFIAWELSCRKPLLQLRIFANRRFSASCMVAFALGVGIYGSTYIAPLFVQLVQGYTPTRAGLLLMPSGFVLALVFPIAGHLGDRIPPWIPVTGGLAIFGISNWLCSGANVDTSFWSLAAWIVLGRIGLGFITPSLNAGALRALPHEQLAQGSGTVNFVRQFGGAMGVNLLSVLIDRRTTFHGDALGQAVTPATSAAYAAIRQLDFLFVHWGNPFGNRIPAGVPPAAMEYLEGMLIPKARWLSYQDGFLAVALMFFISLVPALLMRRGKDRELPARKGALISKGAVDCA
jgi:EmrB/QacA subfamily drug resistance transporter